MVRRRSPDLLRTAGRAAVISSAATASSRAVHNAMDRKAMQAQQAQMSAMQTQQEMAQMQAQLAAVQSVSPPATALNSQPDLLDQLTRLGQLKEAGILTEDEFQLAKTKLLN